MSAIVALPFDKHVEVPDANHATIDNQGRLVLYCGNDSYGQMAGIFKAWEWVSITQRRLRGPDGKFVARTAVITPNEARRMDE